MLDSPGLRIAVRRDPPTVEDLRSTAVPDDPAQRRDITLLDRAFTIYDTLQEALAEPPSAPLASPQS